MCKNKFIFNQANVNEDCIQQQQQQESTKQNMIWELMWVMMWVFRCDRKIFLDGFNHLLL